MTTYNEMAKATREKWKDLIADPKSIPTLYDNSDPKKANLPDDSVWVQLSLLTGTAFKALLTGKGAGRYRQPGILVAAVHAPALKGTKAAETLVDDIVNAFREATGGGVRYWTPTPERVGVRGPWWIINVNIPVTADDP